MITEHLNAEEQRQGYTHRFRIFHTDLIEAVAATPQVISLFTPAAGQVCERVSTRLAVAFEDTADAANNSTTASVGDNAGATTFVNAQQVNVNGTEVYYVRSATAAKLYTAADDIDITLTPPAGKTLLALDKGELVVLAKIVDLNAL